ncbi:hypothetical protein HDU90_003898 [Geranomyces variabilis]|nr:hypothetical protein HDU90_003898 [Geranomyces variabilis]
MDPPPPLQKHSPTLANSFNSHPWASAAAAATPAFGSTSFIPHQPLPPSSAATAPQNWPLWQSPAASSSLHARPGQRQQPHQQHRAILPAYNPASPRVPYSPYSEAALGIKSAPVAPLSEWSAQEALEFLAISATQGDPPNSSDSSAKPLFTEGSAPFLAEPIDLTAGSSSDEGASNSPRKRKAVLSYSPQAGFSPLNPAKRRSVDFPGGPQLAAAHSHPSTSLQNAEHAGRGPVVGRQNHSSEVLIIDDSPQQSPRGAHKHIPRPRLTVAEASSSGDGPIDLTDIDPNEELQLKLRSKQAKRLIAAQGEIVCYGMVQTTLSRLNYEAYKQTCGTDKHMRVVIVPEVPAGHAQSARSMPFSVQAQCGLKLGKLPEDLAIVISPFYTQLTLEANIPRCQYNKYTAPLNIIIIGPLPLANKLGSHLAACNISLQEVTRSLGNIRYYNPQRVKMAGIGAANPNAPGYSSAWCRSSRAETPSAEDVKSQIDAVYNAITSAENLGQADPDEALATSLYKHQKQALYFMTERERPVNFASNTDCKRSLWAMKDGSFTSVVTGGILRTIPTQALGGILADDMGLGKTIETIALILTNRPASAATPPRNPGPSAPASPQPNPYPFLPARKAAPIVHDASPDPKHASTLPSRSTLIVCPLSTVANWEEQIATHVKAGALTCYVYHGPQRKQDPTYLKSFDVVITTYNVLALEYGKEIKAAESPGTRSPLQAIYWLRAVLDEAHVIKERTTSQAKAAFALSAERRWCLTGTPIHNKIDDLFPLFRFLGLSPFNDYQSFAHFISKPLKASHPAAVSRLQTVMKLVTLRRTKNMSLDGKPILTLPPKRQHVYTLTLDPDEQAVYDKVFEKAQAIFSGLEKSGKVFRYYAALLEMLLRLRQCVSHVGLIKDWKGFADITEEMDDEAGDIDLSPLTTERATHLLALLRDSGDDRCCACGIVADGGGSDDRTIVVSACGHLFCGDCVRGVMTGGPSSSAASNSGGGVGCPMCGAQLTARGLKEIKDVEDADKQEEEATAFADLGGNGGGGFPPGVLTSSTKVRTLIADLKHMRTVDPAVKSVVFSQWTQMLDLCGPPLRAAGIRHCRLDGKMSRADRTLALERFRFDPAVTVMLVSLKAGGVGLNLTSASRVYILEPYWNPAVEDQAQDRVHRMGQTRAVDVVRFVVDGSVEEVIEALKKRKRELVATAFREEKANGGGTEAARGGRRQKEEMQLKRLEDLRALFGFKDK